MGKRKLQVGKLYAPALIDFDYAIMYLLEYKKEYDLVESFISALLKTQGYKEVKIKEILRNNGDLQEKRSIAHPVRSIAQLMVEDQDHQQYIVDIERFVNEMDLNTARRIIDDRKRRTDYKNPLKAFYISFIWGQFNGGPLYHRKATASEIGSKASLTQQISTMADTLPEYFVISMTGSRGRLETEIDDWLYAMKYRKIPDICSSSHMKQVDEKLNYLKMPFEAHRDYLSYSMEVSHDIRHFEIVTKMRGNTRAEATKRAEILAKRNQEIALGMLEEHIDVKVIAKISKLSLEQIERLKPVFNEGK